MLNQVDSIPVQKLIITTDWSDDKKVLNTTIKVTTSTSPLAITQLLELQHLGLPLWLTIGSDQTRLPLDGDANQPTPPIIRPPTEDHIR